MQLSVAKRIIIGFTVITVLLLITSINTLRSASQIRSATHQVNSIAVPAILTAEKLEAALAQMQINQVAGFVESSQEELDRQQAEAQRNQQTYQSELSYLRSLTSEYDQFPEIISELDAELVHLQRLAGGMFESRSSIINSTADIEESIEEQADAADEASSLLLDFIDSVSYQTAEIEDAVAAADELEGKLMSWLELSEEMVDTSQQATLDTIYQEQGYLGRDLVIKADHMINNAAKVPGKALLEEAVEIVKQLIDESQSEGNLQQLHQQRLNSIEQSAQNYEQGKQVAMRLNQQIHHLNEAIAALTQAAQDDVDEQIASANQTTIIIVAISILLAVAISYLVVRSISVPMAMVNQALSVIASGNLTQQLDANKQDEFGQLSANVNSLTTNLKELVNAIISRSTQLAAAAEETSSITVESTRSIQEQKGQVDQVAAATTQMSSTAAQVESIAQDTRTTILNADSETQHTIELANQSQEALVVLSDEVSQASQTIAQLHDDTASISSILDVIRGIAEQTNLLALNAAIEAARAGEQGRGFAVVADEVRNLASRTQDSTQEISEMIVRLQEGAKKAVAAMEKGESQAQQCVAQTEESNVALQAITQSVHQAVEMSSQISQAAQEQNLVTSDISQKLEIIVGLSEDTSQGAGQTESSSQEVARLAEELQASIKQFTV